MSARQPFVPQLRPSSRMSTGTGPSLDSHEQNNSGDTSPNGPLTDSGDSGSYHKPTSPQDILVSIASPLAGISKPLNIAGLTNSKLRHARKSLDDISSRVYSPRPPLTQHTARTPASVSFFSATSDSASIPSFRLPLAQLAFKSRPSTTADQITANQTHISSLRPDTDGLRTVQASNYISSPPSGSPRHGNTRSSLENICEEDEGKLNDTCGAGNPEQDLHRQHDSKRHAAAQSETYDTVYVSPEQRPTKPPLRRAKRHIERIEDVESESSSSKRPRIDNQEALCDHDDLRFDLGTPPPPPPFSLPSMHTPSPPPYMRQHPGDVQEPEIKDNAIRRLLGQDLDAYASAHISTYEESKQRWSECSQEEWMTGANGTSIPYNTKAFQELTEKFTKLIDFVKDHMTAKLGLYTSLHSSLSAHRTMLADREEMLKSVRDSLARDGDKFVSGRISTSHDEDEVKENPEL
ncbi:uncharacterized protein PHACADRAFT_183399 [Phanerochaete carnosa HHB-10118-sp]|uniref:Extracellular mutant protein 11 C-terminal domain-containing protein n=1 Tax=Phanerochaete carnosa (strain HHB-10118-sp) TaxID=650164 RepID=K5WC87_PHACS|nr:uncharacterized protein PHACADRAFT_183399 [Phanerochaete carnosa HHB-10118-sp]EKM56815.1 hypothetical protein PHACADRAFT_183399 [Phanerochaete carnosa HHB-10118-sp]